LGSAPAKRAETLVGSMADQGFETMTDGFGTRRRAPSFPGFVEEFAVDIQGFLHTSNLRHMSMPIFTDPQAKTCPL
jgi:hypothetical protein